MKRPILRTTTLTLVCYAATAITGIAQGVFQVIDVPGLGGPSYFEIGADTGLFQIEDPAFPSLPDNVTALITTPAGTLTFSIGNGTPCVFSYDFGDPFPNPFIPPPPPPGFGAPLEELGEYFSGSFQCSADVYADLLAGDGQFQIGSGTSSPMEVVATPEPGSAMPFLCGLVLLMRRRITRVYHGLRVSNNRSQQPMPL
jgi:hypothetical protein